MKQEHKSDASGLDPVTDSIDSVSSEGVSLRVQLQRAIDEERCASKVVPCSAYCPAHARSVQASEGHAPVLQVHRCCRPAGQATGGAAADGQD